MTMNAVWTLFGLGALGAVIWMALLYILHRRGANIAVGDFGWAVAIGLLALFYGMAGDGHWSGRLAVVGVAVLWSGRLAAYVFWTRIRKEHHDGRYKDLLAKWGDGLAAKLFGFFMLQAAGAVVLSVVFLPIVLYREPIGLARFIGGLVLAAVAVWGEGIADDQLLRWKRDPANSGKTCRRGLWRYSRHPNYFFEWVYWWSYVALGLGLPWGWLTLIGPVVMLILLYRGTGIPYAEKQALKSREDYRQYQQETSPFIPWFPKESKQ